MRQLNEKLMKEIINDYPVVELSQKREESVESSLSPTLIYILKEVQKELAIKNNGDILKALEMDNLIFSVSERLGFSINSHEKDEVLTYIEKEQKPFGILQELVEDSSVNDIIVTAYNKILVQTGRKNYKTGLSFASSEDYECFVEKILNKASTSYSTKNPIADGMVGSSARIHVVHKVLCEEGPYLTIRLNRYSEISVDDLVGLKLAPKEVLDYLSALVYGGHTVMLAGEVGTGKTTLARALASKIPKEDSILVIEDTPEINLLHPHVRYMRTRVSNNEGVGKISPSECIRAGMRMAMNRIVFGEIRDAEAAESFIDVCSSGHPGISTVHARNAYDTVARLELFLGRAQKGAAQSVLTQQVGNAIQAVVHIDICQQTGKRRIMEVKEIGAFADNVLRQKTIFEYEFENNKPTWRIKNCVSDYNKSLLEYTYPIYLNQLPSKIGLASRLNYLEVA